MRLESMLEILNPLAMVYYTMSLQLFFLYMAAATFYSEKSGLKEQCELVQSPRPHSSAFCRARPCHCCLSGGTDVAIAI